MSRRSGRATLAVLLFVSVHACSLAASAAEVRFAGRGLFEASVTSRLRMAAADQAIELDRGELIEDDGAAAGFSYRANEEKLTPGVRIRKQLVVADPRTTGATLLVGGSGELRLVINGRDVDLPKAGKAGAYWEQFRLEPAALKAGVNDIVLHGNGRVWIARDDEAASGGRAGEAPNRSARSADGGQTWSDRQLGPAGDIDGEYCVRLFLDRFRASGVLTLPVVDSGNLAGGALAPAVAKLGPVRVSVQGSAGPAGRIHAEFRTGTEPDPASKTWTAWQPLPADGEVHDTAGRYVQVRVQLTTTDPLATPRLEQVAIAASPEIRDDWTNRVKVVAVDNPPPVRSSIPFVYEPFDRLELKRLRQEHKLDEVVAGASDELQLCARLAAWCARQFPHGGHLKTAYPAWNALEILHPHADGTPVGGFCQQYNVVLLQACESFGIVGRAVSIGPGSEKFTNRGGHEVVELWSNQHRKWFYLDGNMAWYAIDARSKAPLSLWELRERQQQVRRGAASPPVEIVTLAKADRAWKDLTDWPPFVELRLIPRSDFLAQQAPLPLNQGMRGWFWTGHYAWTDDAAPAPLLYGHREGKRQNWEWTLNHAQFWLEATHSSGQLRVHLATVTPGFSGYQAAIDDRVTDVTSGFAWTLNAGRNRLRVWPRNTAGRKGSVSSIELDYRER